MRLSVVSPLEAGGSIADIDMVHEYVTWFAPKGLRSARIRFTVA